MIFYSFLETFLELNNNTHKKRDATRAWIKEAEWVSPEARSARGAVPLSHQKGKTEGGEVSLE